MAGSRTVERSPGPSSGGPWQGISGSPDPSGGAPVSARLDARKGMKVRSREGQMKNVRQTGAGQRGQARAVGDDAHALIGLGNSLRGDDGVWRARRGAAGPRSNAGRHLGVLAADGELEVL